MRIVVQECTHMHMQLLIIFYAVQEQKFAWHFIEKFPNLWHNFLEYYKSVYIHAQSNRLTIHSAGTFLGKLRQAPLSCLQSHIKGCAFRDAFLCTAVIRTLVVFLLAFTGLAFASDLSQLRSAFSNRSAADWMFFAYSL